MLNNIMALGISKQEAKELIKVSDDINRDYKLLQEGFPTQYIIGYVNFYGNKIKVNKNVLIPRFETELLVEKSINYIKNMFVNPKILDMCTGSGAIAISIKKSIICSVDASDISQKAIDVAKSNSKINQVEIKFIKSDIFKSITSRYDVIVSNPPYVAYDEVITDSVKKYEPNIALYAEENGLSFYRKIIEESSIHLNERFLIAFEIGCTQAEEIVKIAQQVYPNAKIFVEKDYSLKDRYIFIKNE